MCGHVGIAGKLEYRDELTMKRLLIFDYFRGPDSTGLAVLRKDGNVKMSKMASHPIDLFDSKKFQEALSGYNSSVFLGHNRLATKGKVNGVNAHPFQFGHIVGAHNGTLDKSSWEKMEELAGEKFDVDSQAIFAAIAAVGIEEVVPHLQGAWALVWINLKENTLNFLRNKERSFWTAFEKDFKKIFWASEWPMIEGATKLSGTSLAYDLYHDKEGHRYWSTEVDWWYRFDLDALSNGDYTSRPNGKVCELKGKEPAPVAYAAGGTDPFTGVSRMSGQGSWMTQLKTSHLTGKGQKETTTATKKEGSVVNLFGSSTRPLAGAVSADQFQEICGELCSYCGGDVDYGDVGVTVNIPNSYVLCPECSGHKEHSRVYVEDPSKALNTSLIA